jgi:hypothetical protein
MTDNNHNVPLSQPEKEMFIAEYKLEMISKYIGGLILKNPTQLVTNNSAIFAQPATGQKKKCCPPLGPK